MQAVKIVFGFKEQSTGCGKLRIRSDIEVSGKDQITIKSVPYSVNTGTSSVGLLPVDL